MGIATEKVYEKLINKLSELGIKTESHKFESGAIMVDIWLNNNFYVVSIEKEFIGFDQIDEESGITTIPDHKFFNINDFEKKLKSILNIEKLSF
jgi:hypothetical protein